MESQTFCSFITKNTTVIWGWAPSSPLVYLKNIREIQNTVVVCDLSDMLTGITVLHWLKVFLPSLTLLIMASYLVLCIWSVRQQQYASEWWRRIDRSMLYPKLTENRNSAPLFRFFLHTPWTNTPLKEGLHTIVLQNILLQMEPSCKKAIKTVLKSFFGVYFYVTLVEAGKKIKLWIKIDLSEFYFK